jgi:hypothetical protein
MRSRKSIKSTLEVIDVASEKSASGTESASIVDDKIEEVSET